MRSPEIRLPGVVRVGFLLLIAHSSSYLLMKVQKVSQKHPKTNGQTKAVLSTVFRLRAASRFPLVPRKLVLNEEGFLRRHLCYSPRFFDGESGCSS